jgi:peroxiredoxin
VQTGPVKKEKNKMKKLARILAPVAILGFAAAFTVLPVMEELAIGAAIPKAELKMQDVTGKEVSLSGTKTAKGLLVIFSCNTCPYVKMSETRIKEAETFCKANGLGMILVNSNEDQREGDDSFDAMKKYATEQGITVPYVLDKSSQLADAFGAARTPQCFLFDAAGTLAYKGAIDDNVKDPKAVTKAYLKDALAAVAKGAKPEVKESKSIGCSIKRVNAD